MEPSPEILSTELFGGSLFRFNFLTRLGVILEIGLLSSSASLSAFVVFFVFFYSNGDHI